jgi:hypothetical protein
MNGALQGALAQVRRIEQHQQTLMNGSVAKFAQGGMKGQVALVYVGITQPERRTVRPHCGPPHGLLQAALCAACA